MTKRQTLAEEARAAFKAAGLDGQVDAGHEDELCYWWIRYRSETRYSLARAADEDIARDPAGFLAFAIGLELRPRGIDGLLTPVVWQP